MPLPKVIDSSENWQIRRKEITKIIHEEYLGNLPEKSEIQVSFEKTELFTTYYGGKATKYELIVTTEKEEITHSFPVQVILPHKKHIPVILHIAFESLDPFCGEEIIDHGYGVVKVNYNDIEPDDQQENFTGFAALMPKDMPCRWGKFGCWAFGCSLIMDGLGLFPEIDLSRVALVGHSRLAMTALYAGAIDSRFCLIGAINSGALHRGTNAESFADLSREYTRYWFTRSLFEKYHSEEELPFDNHFLIALCAPTLVYLSAASLDEWCDPKSLLLSGKAASPAYETMGMKGLIIPEDVRENVLYADGNISYYLRTGTHYFGRDDVMNVLRICDRYQSTCKH